MPRIRYLFYGADQHHELTIARIVDQIYTEGRLDLSSIQEGVRVVDFMMTGFDGEFLVNHVCWRMDNPIVK
jgi:hypothetical protein